MSWTYPVIMLSAIAASVLISRHTQKGSPLSVWEKIGIGLGAYCGAMIGAKLPFVLSEWEGLFSGAAWFSNGKTILCGLVGGYAGVEAAKWSMMIKIKTGDGFAVPVAVGVAIGRLGCFDFGCCYGTPTDMPWGVVFPAAGEMPRHPTQLYETVFHLSMALMLYCFQRRGMFRGQLIKLYIMTYAGYRFCTEFIRPEERIWFGMTGYQVASVFIAFLFAYLWWRDARLPENRLPENRLPENRLPENSEPKPGDSESRA